MNNNNKEYIHFSDPKIADLIRWKLGIDSDKPIPVQNLTSIEILTAVYIYIRDLSGIEHLTELKNLNLYSNNEIEDISPLAKLKKLTHLTLNDNKIKDITPLAGLTQLQTLFLNINEISDFTPIADLTQLRSLWLGSNPIQDLSHIYRLLKRFPLLTSLSMNRLHISSVAPFAEYEQLTDLYLEGNDISAITPLAKLTNLESLRLRDNKIKDVSIIENLPRLSSLTIKGNPIQDMTPIYKLRQQKPKLKLDIDLPA